MTNSTRDQEPLGPDEIDLLWMRPATEDEWPRIINVARAAYARGKLDGLKRAQVVVDRENRASAMLVALDEEVSRAEKSISGEG